MHEKEKEKETTTAQNAEKSIILRLRMDLDWTFDCSGNRCILSIYCKNTQIVVRLAVAITTGILADGIQCNCISTSTITFLFVDLHFLCCLVSVSRLVHCSHQFISIEDSVMFPESLITRSY